MGYVYSTDASTYPDGSWDICKDDETERWFEADEIR